MKGLTYRNNKTTLPGWVDTVHVEQFRGYAYETDTHFVHMYGGGSPYHIMSVGLTAFQAKVGMLEEWVEKTFGATEIQTLDIEVGHSIKGVWRPCLYYYADTYQALGSTEIERRLTERSLRSLLDKLDELFLYIEPDEKCLDSYSNKTRELLILACTEIESTWKQYMRIADCKPMNNKLYTTKDYVKLLDKLHLKDYQVTLRGQGSLLPFRPFHKWSHLSPSTSLDWYDAYNKTKHDHLAHLSSATLRHCIDAIIANLIMYCVRFSPFPLSEGNNVFSTMVNEHFQFEMVEPDWRTFYIHKFSIPAGTRADLVILDPHKLGWAKPFEQLPLVL